MPSLIIIPFKERLVLWQSAFIVANNKLVATKSVTQILKHVLKTTPTFKDSKPFMVEKQAVFGFAPAAFAQEKWSDPHLEVLLAKSKQALK
jgi:hypothetical protein